MTCLILINTLINFLFFDIHAVWQEKYVKVKITH